jgi:hypothetical protein
MMQTLEDMLADQPTQLARWKLWLRTMLDLPITTAYQYAQTGGATMNQAPNYAKQGTLLSAALLLPFVIVITLNIIHPFAGVWRTVEYISVFILPVVALVMGLAVLGRLLISHDLWARVKSIKQLQNNWILLAVPLLASVIVTFAFGHDSVHCVTDNPLKAISHPAHTLECVTRG